VVSSNLDIQGQDKHLLEYVMLDFFKEKMLL